MRNPGDSKVATSLHNVVNWANGRIPRKKYVMPSYILQMNCDPHREDYNMRLLNQLGRFCSENNLNWSTINSVSDGFPELVLTGNLLLSAADPTSVGAFLNGPSRAPDPSQYAMLQQMAKSVPVDKQAAYIERRGELSVPEADAVKGQIPPSIVKSAKGVAESKVNQWRTRTKRPAASEGETMGLINNAYRDLTSKQLLAVWQQLNSALTKGWTSNLATGITKALAGMLSDNVIKLLQPTAVASGKILMYNPNHGKLNFAPNVMPASVEAPGVTNFDAMARAAFGVAQPLSGQQLDTRPPAIEYSDYAEGAATEGPGEPGMQLPPPIQVPAPPPPPS